MPYIPDADGLFPYGYPVYGGLPFTVYPEGDYCDPADYVAPLKVLALGNSITYHPASTSLGWYNRNGMAGNSLQGDYVHRLARMVADRIDRPVSVKHAAIWMWERDYPTYTLTQLSEYRDFRPDVYISRAGDNIADADPNIPTYLVSAVNALADYVTGLSTSRIIYTGTFYQRSLANAAMRTAALASGYSFAELYDLWAVAAYHATGQFENAGVADHPSDAGMAAIATRILNAGISGGAW